MNTSFRHTGLVLIVSNSFRQDAAAVEILDFDENGELIIPPGIIIDGYDKKSVSIILLPMKTRRLICHT